MNRAGYKALFILILLLTLITINVSANQSNSIQVSFIDVGQGDSALIQDDTGFDVLIDGGIASAGPTVVAYIREQGVDDIEVMVASHADSDHIGGLIEVLNAPDISVDMVLYNGYPGDTLTWDTFVTAVANEGATLIAAQFPLTYTWGSSTAHIMNPVPELTNPDQNDVSVVILLDSGEVEYLFTGDIDSTVEADIVARGTPVAADILKVPHHGSKYSSSEYFLSAVQPAEAVISVGDNPYGHPTDETIQRLLDAGARIWRTDEQGTIVVESDGFTYNIYGELDPINLAIFLPLLIKETPPPPPTPEPTEEPTIEPTEEPTIEPTEEPTPEPEVDIRISNIFYDGVVPYVESDEYAQVTNNGAGIVDLQGWRLNAGDPGQDFSFPSFNIQPDQSCRVYTNEDHPESCGFSFGSGTAIWSNSGDCGRLYNSDGQLVDEYCY